MIYNTTHLISKQLQKYVYCSAKTLYAGQEKCLISTNNMQTDNNAWYLRLSRCKVPTYDIHYAWYPMYYIQWLDWTITELG